MEKLPLSRTNPYLKDPGNRTFWIVTTVTSSASIEGVRYPVEEAMEALRKRGPAVRRPCGGSSGPRK